MWTATPVSSSPVEDAYFSPLAVHCGNRLATPFRAVVPEVHTPYDFYERIS
jgi:hypothetical protein